jgi:hypothetical protein
MVIKIEDMRLGRKVKFRGSPDKEGDINTGLINGTSYVLEDDYFYVPVWVAKLANGRTDQCMVICSDNIVGVSDD